MTNFGALRVWAALLSFVGTLGLVSALVGTIVWAIEVDGFWRTLGVVLFGSAASVVLGIGAMAIAQALRAVADIGETVNAR
jgi:multisubunit Na+/H+ antiporter MnhG subunit